MATDFQTIVDSIGAMTCVVSVEHFEDGSCGEFRIVTGNPSYITSIEQANSSTRMLTQKFIPNSLYTDYLTRDLNFEDYCYRAAVKKQCLHSYAHPERMNVWFNMTFLPLDADDGNLSYCTYTMEIDFKPNSERLSNVTSEFASQVLNMAIALRNTDDFKSAMATVANDVRSFCKAEYCGILLVNESKRTCSMLGESIAEGSNLLPMETYIDNGFYSIVESWDATISGSNCIIVKNKFDMDVVKERNPQWHESLTSAFVNSIVLFPLKSHGELLGYIWVVNFNPDDSPSIKEALELTTYVLASEIDNHLLIELLKELSSKDALTGLLNRHEMDVRINKLVNGEEGAQQSVGVIFVDLNGLKVINDKEGHPSGDKLIVDGAKTLAEVLPTNVLYRTGGDEFVAILTDITEREIEEAIAAIKQAQHRYDRVDFAIGSHLEPDAKNVRRALRIADTRMYEDKDRHYGKKK